MMTVEKIKDFAKKHYNDGLDVIIECYEDKDIQEIIDRGNVIETLKTIASITNDNREAANFYSGEHLYTTNTSYKNWKEEDLI